MTAGFVLIACIAALLALTLWLLFKAMNGRDDDNEDGNDAKP